VPDPRVDSIFRDHFPVIRAKCARMLGWTEDAADVAQETFVRLCESDILDREPAVRIAWIYRTSTRLAVDLIRRRRLGIERPSVDDDAAADHAGADEALAARQRLAAIAGAASQQELEVALLCRVDGMTQPEAAAVCGVSERTVRRLLERLDRKLAELEGRAP
jgi:RNA polymerase sigma-70 factor (ECF subfamily)